MLGFRSTTLTGVEDVAVVSSDTGDFAFLSYAEAQDLANGVFNRQSPRGRDLEAKGLLGSLDYMSPLERTVHRTRKAFVAEGPSLHIFVVTLRCDHSCQYCQVSRAATTAGGFDMTLADAAAGVERVFESPSKSLTIEFQGGEPALRFDMVREIVRLATERNEHEGRALSFAMVTTLHHLSDDDLAFCREHKIHLSTSIDGPKEIHERQRPNPTRDSWTRTIDNLGRARSILGHDGVAALPTLSRQALRDPKAIVDTYVDLGFRSIFMRPISPYGFARKTARALGASVSEFLASYEIALAYILELNAAGIEIEETYAAILLRHILTPFHSGYMDMRSPSAAGLGVLVYNYDGLVYPSDEARMAAEAGDTRFSLGSVHDCLDDLMASPAMAWLAQGAVAEALPGCSDCAFVPYCGADPVHHAYTQGSPMGDRASSEYCAKQTGLFNIIFRHIRLADPETMRTFTAWAMRKPRAAIQAAAWCDT